MFRLFPSATCVCYLLLTLAASAQQADFESMATFSHVSSGDTGICPGALLSNQDGPIAWFGLNKRPAQQTEYTYIILFPAPTDEKMSITGFKNRSDVSDNKASAEMELTWQKHQLRVSYNFEADPKTGNTLKDELALDGKPVNRKSSPVFLLDISTGQPNFRRVEVEVATPAPDVTADSDDWSDAIKKVIKSLCEKSPEVAKFLGDAEGQR